ncbi:MAG: lysylphosphatidylglycerol synthase transmembrane domain-containing protein [Candidatus Aenigmatarchaeota archaeon]
MKKAIGFAAGLIIVIAVFGLVGVSSIIIQILEAEWGYFLLAIWVSVLIMLLHSYRLRLIVNSQMYKIGFLNAAKIHIASNSVNLITPVVKAGGIPLKVHYLSKTNIPSIRSCALVIGEIATETISFYSTFVVLLLVLILTHRLPPAYAYIGFGLAALIILVSLLLFKIMLSPRTLRRLIKGVILRFTSMDPRLSSKIFNCSMQSFLKNRQLWTNTLSISFFCRFLEFLRIYLVFLAFGFGATLGVVLTIWVVETLLSGIPWFPGGLGLVEGGTISLLSLLSIPGLSAAMASSFILFDRIAGLWIPLAIGLLAAAEIKRNGVKKEP